MPDESMNGSIVGNMTLSNDVTTGVYVYSTTGNHVVSISNQNFILSVMYYVIGSIGLVGNLVVVVVIFQYTQMRRVLTNIYVINQSLLDGLAAVFLILTTGIEDDGDTYFQGLADDIYCRVWASKVPLWSMLFSSTYNLVALTIERYVAVAYPIRHRVSFTQEKVTVTLVSVWLVGLCIQLPLKLATGYLDNGKCHVLQNWASPQIQRGTGVFLIFVQFLIPITIITFCYTKMFLILKVTAKVAPALEGPASEGTTTDRKWGVEKSARARRNIFKTLVIVAVCYILCWAWNQINFLLYNLGVVGVVFTSAFYHFTVIAVFLNCCINPIIYIIHYEQFRRGLRQLRRRLCGVKRSLSGEDGGRTNTNASFNRSQGHSMSTHEEGATKRANIPTVAESLEVPI